MDADQVRAVFDEIHRRAFLMDTATNRRLSVDVVDAGEIGSARAFILIAPWTLNALVFTPDGRLSDRLEISAREHRAYLIDVPGLGPHHVINLVPDVSQLPSHDHALKTANAMVEPLRQAIARARDGTGAVDPSRRALLRRPVRALSG